MGRLVDGKWHDVWFSTRETGGRFVRPESLWRDWITREGLPVRSYRSGSCSPSSMTVRYLPQRVECPPFHRTPGYWV